MYTYYIKVESEEHMLFASEIAKAFNLYSESNKPHIKLISTAIKHILKKESFTGSIYYQTKGSLRQVYPSSIYLKAIDYIEKNSHVINNTCKGINIDGMNLRFKI